MLPVILVAVGAYLIGDSVLSDKKYSQGGQIDAKSAKKRLEQLRKELRAERISYAELAELESLKEYIDKDDVELLEAAGVPEYDEEDEYAKGGEITREDITILGVPRSKITDKEWESIIRMSKYQKGASFILKDEKGLDVKPQIEYEWYVNEKMAKGGEVAKYKVGDMVYSYQNNEYAAPISYTTEVSYPNDKVKYKLKLKDGYSNWINEDSLHKTKQKEHAKGGYMADGGRIKVGTFDEQQLIKKEDKKAVEKAREETGLKYVDTKIIKKGGKMYMEVYLIPNEEYYNSSKFSDGGYMAEGGKLVGKQKNLDVNKNGKLDAEDFKILRGKKMADGGETKMPYKEFEETLREYEIEGGFGKTIEKGYEMYYLPKGNPYLNTKFNHRNKKKAYQQYVKMDR